MTSRHWRLLGAALVLGALAAAASWAWRGGSRDPVARVLAGGGGAAGEARAPDGARIRVQVLNATRTRGLARRASLYLRDRGFDVVETGSGGAERGTTLVLDRSGHPEWARAVSAALGGATVESRPDTSRYLDVTVLLGRDWRPPAQPFYP